MPSSAQILPNISRVEKHLEIYCQYLTKPRYQHFKNILLSFISGKGGSVLEMARYLGTQSYRLYYFFNDMDFDDKKLLAKSVSQLNNKTCLRSTQESFLIFDFTSTAKTGRHFEWADWLWNEETNETDAFGHETLVALEYDPKKNYRKALGLRRFYHEDKLFETEYTKDDFEKKPTVVNHLLKEIQPLTRAKEVLVDGEFISGFLVDKFENQGYDWTGRIKKTILAAYKREQEMSLEDLTNKLIQEKEIIFEEVIYRSQKIMAVDIEVKVPSLGNRKIRVAVCKNDKGKFAFIASSVIGRSVHEIVKVYGFRWEIEVFFKDIKQNLHFSDYLLRSTGANIRWQYLVLIAANIIELMKKILISKYIPKFSWFKKTVKHLFQKTKLTIGLIVRLISDLKNGGREFIAALKCLGELHHAKFYLYRRINL